MENNPSLKHRYLIYRAVNAALCHGLRALPTWTWTERAALWWGYRYKPAPRAVKLRSGASIFVNPRDYLQLLIYYIGAFEPHCLPYLKGCVTRGGTIIDVGANIGFYTLESALAVGPSGRVISIEAAPPHVETLRQNIKLNGLKNISLIEVAVGEAKGSAMLALPRGDNLGMFTLGSVNSEETYLVDLRPIDDVLAEQRVQSVDLIKMDIEGSEYRALCGAKKTLLLHKPALLIELNEVALNQCGSSTQAVKELLREAGYRGWLINRGGHARPIPEVQATHDCDECLFIHREKVSLVRKLGLPNA